MGFGIKDVYVILLLRCEVVICKVNVVIVGGVVWGIWICMVDGLLVVWCDE